MSKRWPMISLDQICRPKQWPTISAKDLLNQGYPVFGANGIIGYYSEYNHEDETILITCRGATCGTINISIPRSYVTGNAMCLDDLDENKCHLKFIYHALVYRGLSDAITGSAQPQITRQSLEKVAIPLPPLAEQRRIATILDKADAIRRKRQQAIKLADDFLRATFLDMFGDPVTNPKGWQIRPLSEIVKKGRIVTYGIVQAGPPLPEGVPYIRTGDIQDGKINTSGLLKTSYEIASRYKRSEVNKGDIVMSIRATVGTVAPLPEELDGANLTQGTARISPGSSTNREFLLWTLKTRGIQNWIEKQVKGATFREITLAKLRELPVIVPPLESQEKFQSIVFQTQKLDAEINKADNSCNEFFNSLTQRAFRGDL